MRKAGIEGLPVELADCAERRYSGRATRNGETAAPLAGKEMPCIWLLRPVVGDLGRAGTGAGTAVAGDGEPRARFVEERRRFRKGEREERNGPAIFCCVLGSRGGRGAPPLALRKEEEVDGACEELVRGLLSSPVSIEGVVAGEITVGTGKPADVFGRVSCGAGLGAVARVSVADSVDAQFSSSDFAVVAAAAAAAAAAAVFLCRRKRERRSIVAAGVAD